MNDKIAKRATQFTFGSPSQFYVEYAILKDFVRVEWQFLANLLRYLNATQ